METLIEIFTEEVKDNIYGALSLKPKKVIFLVEKEKEEAYKYTKKYLMKALPQIMVTKEIVEFYNYEKIKDIIVRLFSGKDCCLDLTGGNDRIRLPLMSIAMKKGIPCCFIDDEKEDMLIMSDQIQKKEIILPMLAFADILALNGSKQVSNRNYPESSKIPQVDKIIEIAFSDIRSWKRMCTYLSYVYSHCLKENGFIQAKETIYVGNEKLKLDFRIMNNLIRIGVVKDCSYHKGMIQFRFCGNKVRYMFEKQGNVLEVLTYMTLKESNLFQEVDMSVEIDWDGDGKEEVMNEIDVIARKDRKLYFISCKCTNIKTEYLNEIVFLSSRFGKDVVPIIVTTQHQSTMARSTIERARRMRCILIDKEDIEKHRMIEKIVNE